MYEALNRLAPNPYPYTMRKRSTCTHQLVAHARTNLSTIFI